MSSINNSTGEFSHSLDMKLPCRSYVCKETLTRKNSTFLCDQSEWIADFVTLVPFRIGEVVFRGLHNEG